MSLKKCPAPNCDFEGVESAVRGHWGGKSDDEHSGSYEAAKSAFEEARAGAGASEGDGEGSEGGSGENPTMGSGDPDDDLGDEEDLPCGHDSFDPSEAPEPPFKVTCDECGEAWTVTDL